jgi:genome maintenance exonuclease 1
MKFQYPTLNRVTINNLRHYTDGTFDPVPSVTTILSTMSKSNGLTEWISRVGEETATTIKNESAKVGEVMHQNIENFLHDNLSSVTGNLLEKILSRLIISDLKVNLNETWGIECNLYYPDLYAGTADLIGVYKGKPTVIDFKNSRSDKKEEWIDSYFMQAAAYSIAHNYLFGTNIESCVILMATWNGSLKVFEKTNEDFEHYKNLWLELVSEYYKIA